MTNWCGSTEDQKIYLARICFLISVLGIVLFHTRKQCLEIETISYLFQNLNLTLSLLAIPDVSIFLPLDVAIFLPMKVQYLMLISYLGLSLQDLHLYMLLY